MSLCLGASECAAYICMHPALCTMGSEARFARARLW